MQNRRKRVIVLPQLQRRIVARSTLLPCLMLLTISSIVALQFSSIFAEVGELGVEIAGLGRLLVAMLISGVAMCGLVLWQAVYFSHRLAGPVYRITKSMRELGETGRANDLRLRRGDYLTEVADEFNKLARNVAERLDAAGTRTTTEQCEPELAAAEMR